MSNNSQKSGQKDALAGVRVLDFTSMMAGPYCTRLLADLGAEVIKIEPLKGDYMRFQPPLRGECSRYFGHLNAGKKSIAVDLKSEAGIEVIRSLVASSDVVVENFRPGVMARLGLNYESLDKINPRIIYCSISGYGQDGPKSKKPAYAPMIHAASGYDLTLLQYQEEQEKPAITGVFVADILGGLYSTSAIQTALYQRERSGIGQEIDTTLLECMLNLLIYEIQFEQQPSTARRPRYGPLPTKDGNIIVVPINANNFKNLCEVTGHPEWMEDPLFLTPGDRVKNWDELMARVGTWTAERTALECEDILLDAGVPASRYLTVGEAMQDPQAEHRGSFAEVEDTEGGFRVVNPPYKMSGTGTHVRPNVPGLGQHTEEVLKTVAGYDADNISALRDAKTLVFG
ncbi:MAG: carnitine dehydratase [Sneathiella sp.]|uniref:CaiB/BaiF CoA transferase family protein n=1 Tax=Sneathiella sp. TaxID=1964365 RepID=UPI000C4A323F|nr:CoA transferase [Sneathiella sp.]MAZ02391.1 carnitine dehydratase [Sneathiella sp.]